MKNKVGRKSLLVDDPSIQDRICKAVAQGATYKGAAAFGGIHVGTVLHWMSLGREESMADPAGEDKSPYRIFFDSVKKARAICMLRHLANIDRAAESGIWQASAWKLERCFDMTVNRKPEVEVNISVESVDTAGLIEQLKRTEDLLFLKGPVIDVEEE